jgi:anti-sigma-K factor RskA
MRYSCTAIIASIKTRNSDHVSQRTPKLTIFNRVPVAAVAAVAAGTVFARNKITQKREEWEAAAAQAELEARESAERYNRLQDAYAGRTSLTELEAAVKVYEESRE